MKKIILITLLWQAATVLQAQEAWPLDRCIRYALEHNTELQEQRLEAALREAEYDRSRYAMLPSVRAGIGQEWNWGRSVDMQELVIVRNKLTRAAGASLNASLSLFDGLAGHYGRLAAGKAAEAARQDAEDRQNALVIDITRAYLQLMLAKQIHAYAQESHAVIVQQRERTAELVEVGSQPKSALFEIEAQVASEKAGMVEAACRVRTATLELVRLMNLPQDAPFATSDAFGQDSVVRRIPVLTDTQVEDWLQADPRIRSSQATCSEMKHRRAAARGALFPTLQLTASFGTYYSSSSDETFRNQLENNRNPSLSLQLDIPVFQALQANAQLRKSRIALDMARLGVEKTRTGILQEIRSASIEAENCLQKYLSAEESLHTMQGLLEVMEAKYSLGAATALDYILARNNCSKAVSDFLQAKWQYLFQLKLMERYRL